MEVPGSNPRRNTEKWKKLQEIKHPPCEKNFKILFFAIPLPPIEHSTAFAEKNGQLLWDSHDDVNSGA